MPDTESVPEGLTRQELLALHAHYESVTRERLNFCYQYLNFYTGLLSAILAATLAGLLSIKFGDIRGIALLLGPLLTLVFATVGYLSVRVFYRSYIRAWVTRRNIEAMLGIGFAEAITTSKYPPVYASQSGGFLPSVERAPVKAILDTAKREQWNAEKVVQKLIKIGDVLAYVRITFIAFALASIALAAFIVWTALL